MYLDSSDYEFMHDGDGEQIVGIVFPNVQVEGPGDVMKVRRTPSWPRGWANFSVLSLYSHKNAWPTCIFWPNLTPFSLMQCCELSEVSKFSKGLLL